MQSFTSGIFRVVSLLGENLEFLAPCDLTFFKSNFNQETQTLTSTHSENTFRMRKMSYIVEKQQCFQNLVHRFLKHTLVKFTAFNSCFLQTLNDILIMVLMISC